MCFVYRTNANSCLDSSNQLHEISELFKVRLLKNMLLLKAMHLFDARIERAKNFLYGQIFWKIKKWAKESMAGQFFYEAVAQHVPWQAPIPYVLFLGGQCYLLAY